MEDSMTSSTEMRHYPVVEAVIDIFGNWLNHRRDVAQVCDCDDDEFRRIAHDLGVSANDLDGLVRAGPHAADELPKMMAALNLNADDIRRVEPLVMRDMERVCGLCSHKNRCDSELVAGTAAERHNEFCNNALTLDTLIKEGAQKQ
jgi:hypothetical protein